MKEEFSKFGEGKLKDIRMVMPGKEMLGGSFYQAEAGTIFIEYADEKTAKMAMEKVKGRKYDERQTRIVYVKEELYLYVFKNISESFVDINTKTIDPLPNLEKF